MVHRFYPIFDITRRMSEEETETIRIVPPAPTEWLDALEPVCARAAKMEVKYAKSKGNFILARTFTVEWVEKEDAFKLFILDDGTEVVLAEDASARETVEHVWNVLCECAFEYADTHGLRRMRGELSIYDEGGELLNSPSTDRKVIKVGDDEATVEEELTDEEKKKKRKNAREESYAKQLDSLRDKIGASLDSDMDAKERYGKRAMRLGEAYLEFAEKKLADIVKEESDREWAAKRDAIADFAIGYALPKLVDAGASWLRTNGGKKDDDRHVPPVPNKLLAWVLRDFGPDVYAALSEALLAAMDTDPEKDGFDEAWKRVLAMLEAIIKGGKQDETEEGERPLPPDLIDACSSWGRRACDVLGFDPHDFSHVCYTEKEGPKMSDLFGAEEVSDD